MATFPAFKQRNRLIKVCVVKMNFEIIRRQNVSNAERSGRKLPDELPRPASIYTYASKLRRQLEDSARRSTVPRCYMGIVNKINTKHVVTI